MPARSAPRLGVRAVAAAALLLGLAGCVSATPGPSYSSLPAGAGYAPALPGYSPQPRITVAPRLAYPPQAVPLPYRPQPAAIDLPTRADPPADVEQPLILVDPVGRHRVDPSCTDYWDWCHFF